MNQPLDILKAGIRKFHTDIYGVRADAYHKAATEPQRPHTLIVGCADSRVDVSTLTSSGPGEVFITRNVGNMVPAYGETPGGVGAVIEYALDALKVRHVVVCGHLDCGAMKALLQPSPAESMPYVARWLTHGLAALRIAQAIHQQTGRDLLSVLTEQNVLMQLAHLRTHPHIAGALARKALTISGWVYDIGCGNVKIWEGGDNPDAFETIRPGAIPASVLQGDAGSR
ncbi:MAG: carbonic anhydrase [Bryobacteraceae bacterium]|nr:carbonic anhydrase [Bryobacteraceae bacterium]